MLRQPAFSSISRKFLLDYSMLKALERGLFTDPWITKPARGGLGLGFKLCLNFGFVGFIKLSYDSREFSQ